MLGGHGTRGANDRRQVNGKVDEPHREELMEDD
jgi:hypothetical protein